MWGRWGGLTTGLCTSQKALSWLSRIFLSVLSFFLSILHMRSVRVRHTACINVTCSNWIRMEGWDSLEIIISLYVHHFWTIFKLMCSKLLARASAPVSECVCVCVCLYCYLCVHTAAPPTFGRLCRQILKHGWYSFVQCGWLRTVQLPLVHYMC